MIDASAAVRSVNVSTAKSVPGDATAVGYPVGPKGSVPKQLGMSRAALADNGFEGQRGQTLKIPSGDGLLVAIGVGPADEIDANSLRKAAAAFARAASKHARLATTLADAGDVDPQAAGSAVVEGVLLASYRYVGLKTGDDLGSKLTDLTVVSSGKRAAGVGTGVEVGHAIASAAAFARELANTPPTYLNAVDIADKAVALAEDAGLTVEVFNKDDLLAMGCGGMIGVNRGSTEPPRMIKLTYSPKGAKKHLAMVGKGIMYDSGGLALKPGDPTHANMKNDMSGAGAILAAMLELAELGCPTAVTGYLACTDNMPSGTATAMGDVLTIRGGTTVEVANTDAEGRLVMADGLVLATEEPVDAIVDIATLTGACMRALGTLVAGVMGNHQGLVDQIRAAAETSGEPVWQLPLEHRYRHEIDSEVADIKNLGGPNAGAITAALFLAEFAGDIPWAHIDIAGVAQNERDTSWLPPGNTGFGARLLIDLAMTFTRPSR